ncbi:HlyD family efflux transporter periplasmic adaptor subunit [Roseateles sp. PN1]|uniref:HlyD family efflux transporter periplasmic adaptor subunit n=1 Tax=Roseateles sp. PN1 TaxID=3137372 RepID=UPI00313A49A8
MLASSSFIAAPVWQLLLDGPVAGDCQAFHAAWLHTLVQGLQPGVSEAVLVLDGRHLGQAPGELRPAALWPLQQAPGAALTSLCEEALAMRMPLNRQGMLALPLLDQVATQARAPDAAPPVLHGVVGLVFAAGQVPRHAQDWLRWGVGWLLGQGSGLAQTGAQAGKQEQEGLRERMLLALELMVAVLSCSDAQAACNVAVNEAAQRLGCDRVSIGFGNGRRVRLQALSNAADFSRRLDLAHAIEAAMDEACDQACPVQWGGEPGAGGAQAQADEGRGDGEQEAGAVMCREHQQLARGFGTDTLLSVPFFQPAEADLGRHAYGVMLFEWTGRAPDPLSLQMAQGLPPLLGRLLLEKRHARRAWPLRWRDGLESQARALFGPRHALRKLGVLALLGAVLVLATATGPYRVAANAALEGQVRRVVAAPFDGFVASSSVRAGDVVRQGQLMAMLDDRDMRLEADKWASQQTQYAKQAQEAQAQHSLAQIQISMAQIAQASAQRRLSEAMAARSAIRAPLDGLVVSGDLSQSLGAALKKGQSLFEISPLDAYRVILQVDEADVDLVATGQRGELMLTSMPGRTFPFTVRLLTPVAQAKDGHNQFRVEAQLELSADAVREAQLRPGMEGLGKIDMGERRLVWIWTHRMMDWLRLQLWRWLGV